MQQTPDTLWDEKWFIRLMPDEKTIYMYLTTGTRSFTGIYNRMLEEIWFKTRVDQQVIRNCLEMGNLRGVQYDFDLEVVYVHDMFRKNQKFGGDPKRNDVAIMEDHKETLLATSFWSHWTKAYADRVDASPALSVHFQDLDNPRFPSAVTKGGKKRKATREEDAEVEAEITGLLVKYNLLPADQKAAFFRVYRGLTTAPSGRTISPQKRADVLRRLSAYEIEQVGIGAEMFEDAKGLQKATKPLNYLVGIIEKGALSEKVERRNERAKKERGETR